MRTPQEKILTLDQAVAYRDELHKAGKKLVITNGCFDLPHRGHFEYLNAAREEGDALLVAMNSDDSLRRLKGPPRPIIAAADRAYILGSMQAVDAVVIFEELNALEVFKAVPPDVYVKGGDYSEETLNRDEYPTLKATGCRFCFIPFVPGYSTTTLLASIRELQD
jgi:D-glycero-beta-D-manno-heptose 1-phosphate adenylyltransferase